MKGFFVNARALFFLILLFGYPIWLSVGVEWYMESYLWGAVTLVLSLVKYGSVVKVVRGLP
jgi:hypothetical protein